MVKRGRGKRARRQKRTVKRVKVMKGILRSIKHRTN